MPRFRDLASDFRPYGDRTQPTRRIAGYLNTLKRSPRAQPQPRFIDQGDLTGPVFADLRAGENDLSVAAPGAPRALGQLITISGRVLDESGRPVSGALIEMWHANSCGKYIHHNDPSPVPVDPNFVGLGRARTDSAGRYSFRTIKPGGYAVPHEGGRSAKGWWRPPHVHFSLFGTRLTSRLVTQMYFPGEPLNAFDLILNAVPDRAARARLVGTFRPDLTTADGALGFGHDFVLRGRYATPFEGA